MIHIDDLSIGLQSSRASLVLRGVSLDIAAGRRVGVVGESGSGKSTLLRAMTGTCNSGLLRVAGDVVLDGRDLFELPEAERRSLMGTAVALVPQGVSLSLTPHLDIAGHFRDVYALGADGAHDVRDRAAAMLTEVGLAGAAMVTRFPHELSGGEQQRVLIALGLARDPEVLLLDEPTSALDVGVAHDILSMIEDERQRRGFTLVCVSHDLGMIDRIAEDIVVMNLGEIVECGEREQITSRPQHPYTQRLLAAAPRLGERHARRAGEVTGGDPLVEIGSLSVVRSGASRRTLFGPAQRTTVALDDVSLDIRKGEILGVIGESGSGKSTLLKTLCGLLTPTSGAVAMDGNIDLGTRTADRHDDLLHRIQMVFQNPDDSLNPAHTVRRIVAPGVRRRRVNDAELTDLLHTVGLEPDVLDRRPGQLSGGEKQRVAIARALARRPELLLLDEVTSALDVTVQAEVLATLLDIHRRLGTTMVFVSHDLAVVGSIADRVAVLRHGRLVEMGDVEQVLDRPSEPYTDHLVALARRT